MSIAADYRGMRHCATLRLVINFGLLRCPLPAGCRRWWRWYWRCRWYRGRQRRWTGWNGDGNAKWKRHYQCNVRGVGFEHNGNVVWQFADENEYGDDGLACLSQRNEEALLTAVLVLRRPSALGTSAELPGLLTAGGRAVCVYSLIEGRRRALSQRSERRIINARTQTAARRPRALG